MHNTEVDDVSADGVVEYRGVKFDDVIAGWWFPRIWVQQFGQS
jgi:hypothetical protein